MTTPAPGAPKVLLVDDDEHVRAVVVRLLDRIGCRVAVVTSGPEALEMLLEHSALIDLLLTDVDMPEMNGFALATAVAACRPGLPVIFMSGSAVPAPEGGALLRKPFHVTDLKHAISEALPRHHIGLSTPPDGSLGPRC